MSERLQSALGGLPHGPEFRFISEVTELSGDAGQACWWLGAEEHFLKGHFPGEPLMPGVLMVEAIAQLAGIIHQQNLREPAPLRLTAIRQAKILGTVGPGHRLEICARVDGRLGGLVQAQGEVRCGDRLLATAQIVLSGA